MIARGAPPGANGRHGRNRDRVRPVWRAMSNPLRAFSTAVTLMLMLLAGACGATTSPPATPSPVPSPSASPSPSPQPSPSPDPSPSPEPSGEPIVVDTDAEAAALALRSDERFAGIGLLLADVIGQSAWYEVMPTSDGYEVTVVIGWGDRS